MAAVLVTMIAVGVQNSHLSVQATKQTTLVNGFTSVLNIVFAYGAFTAFRNAVLYLTIYSEPQHLLQHDDRAGGLQGIPKGIGVVAVHRRLCIYRHSCGHLYLRW